MKKRMIADKENSGPVSEATPEEEALLERSSAPTLRDLREAAKDLFTNIEAEPDSTSPDDRLPSVAKAPLTVKEKTGAGVEAP